MDAGESRAPAAHRVAYEMPWLGAERWREGGGRVIGVLGRSVPRELVVAAGMLPIRLSPLRLGPPQDGADPSSPGADESDATLPAALAAELGPRQVRVLAALLDGRLRWIDGLVIGRDSESDTKLFYVLRELARTGRSRALPPVAFADLLRLPSRTSARYNRIRARELVETLGAWSGVEIRPEALRDAVADAAETASALRRIDGLRIGPVPGVRGSEALMAAAATQAMPGSAARAALSTIGTDADADRRDPPDSRVLLSGSGQDEVWAYEALEAAGLAVVGEDHEWGDDGRAPAEATRDPLDGIVDARHLSAWGAARAGLHARTRFTVEQVRRTGAEGVVQLVFAHDEAPAWELPALRDALGEGIPIATVRLEYGRRDDQAVARAAGGLLERGLAGAPHDG